MYLVTLSIGIMLAYLVASIAPNMEAANAILPTYVVTLLYFGGLLMVQSSMPVWWRWYSYIDFIRYGWCVARPPCPVRMPVRDLRRGACSVVPPQRCHRWPVLTCRPPPHLVPCRGSLMINQFEGQQPPQPWLGKSSVLEFYGFAGVNKWGFLGYECIFFFVYFVMTLVIMSLRKYSSR